MTAAALGDGGGGGDEDDDDMDDDEWAVGGLLDGLQEQRSMMQLQATEFAGDWDVADDDEGGGLIVYGLEGLAMDPPPQSQHRAHGSRHAEVRSSSLRLVHCVCFSG